MSGTLYLVSSPIGNLGDITLRSIEVLKAASAIVAEDTRRSRQLLNHLGITGKPLHCVDAHAADKVLNKVVSQLQSGDDIALLTDAGTPAVSDPGTALVRACQEAEINVVALPGPSAVTTAVAVSGLVENAFLFLGFLPRKGAKRTQVLEQILNTQDAVVFFEAPTRIEHTLKELAELMPERQLCVTRELSKKFEEVKLLPLSQWATHEREWKGELTLVLADTHKQHKAQQLSGEELDQLIGAGLARGDSAKNITQELLPLAGLPRRELYQRVITLKNNAD